MQGMVAKQNFPLEFLPSNFACLPLSSASKILCPPPPFTLKNGFPPQSNADHTFHSFIAWSLRNKLLTNILNAVPLCPRSCPTLPQELSQFTPGVDDISQKKFKISFK